MKSETSRAASRGGVLQRLRRHPERAQTTHRVAVERIGSAHLRGGRLRMRAQRGREDLLGQSLGVEDAQAPQGPGCEGDVAHGLVALPLHPVPCARSRPRRPPGPGRCPPLSAALRQPAQGRDRRGRTRAIAHGDEPVVVPAGTGHGTSSGRHPSWRGGTYRRRSSPVWTRCSARQRTLMWVRIDAQARMLNAPSAVTCWRSMRMPLACSMTARDARPPPGCPPVSGRVGTGTGYWRRPRRRARTGWPPTGCPGRRRSVAGRRCSALPTPANPR
jgi:hypothetical protein